MRSSITFFLLIAALFGHAQSDSADTRKSRYVVGWFQEKDVKIHGLSIGLTTATDYRNTLTNGLRFELLGLGCTMFFGGGMDVDLNMNIEEENDLSKWHVWGGPYLEKINGINISPLGTAKNVDINGISVNGLMCMHRIANGLTASGFISYTKISRGILIGGFATSAYNHSGVTVSGLYNKIHTNRGLAVSAISNNSRNFNGIQISLFNRTKSGRVLQIGLVNYIKDNPKGLRVLPLINFRSKKHSIKPPKS